MRADNDNNDEEVLRTELAGVMFNSPIGSVAMAKAALEALLSELIKGKDVESADDGKMLIRGVLDDLVNVDDEGNPQ